jgi:tetratricopeptide (TPR) repeat protein/predicted Ser/Thr protein kinase
VPVHTQGSLLDSRYRVIKHLGSGGMASVLLCEDERLGRKVAVKRLHADSPVDVERRFKREAKLGASLNHPNVVSVFDTATDEEGVLIVMEYVEGHPLRQLLRHGPLRPEEVCRIVSDVGDALDHAHAQGVVHRDVKPGNVLIREDGVTKLADLGIATAADDTRITRSGVVLGTAGYMAPEQLDGRGAEPASDIYALAAIAFEGLSGRKPREGKTPMQIAHSMATEDPPDLREAWPRAPAAAARVLQRGMALEPEDRPASAGELARELTDALSEAPESPPPTRRFRRRGAAVAAGGAAAAGAAARVASAPRTGPAGVRRENKPSMPPTAPPRSRARAGRRRPNFAAVALALVFVALAIAAVVGAVTSGGDEERASSGADTTPREPAKKKQQEAKEEPKATEQPKAEESAAPAAPAPAEEQPAPVEEEPAPAEGASGAELNAQGFDLMNQGRYADAIPILQQAVESFPAGTSDLNYAYALFNLGKSLRLAGRADEAVPILEQRLEIPNQTETVRQELELARQQAREQ